jgi:hypothetical protein
LGLGVEICYPRTNDAYRRGNSCARGRLSIAGAGSEDNLDKVYTAERAARGSSTPTAASCHGETLGGVEMPPPLVTCSTAAGSRWRIVRTMRISMPQNKPGSLSRTQNADILAHMLRVGNFPAGDVSLDGQASALAQIKFVTYKPQ